MIAAIVSVCFGIYFLATSSNGTATPAILAQAIFFLGATIVFTCSACFHIFMCCSQHTFECAQKCDHLGIVVGFWCSTSAFSMLYFCQAVSWYVIGATILVFPAAWLILYNYPPSRLFRTLVYVLLGLYNIAPLVHYIHVVDRCTMVCWYVSMWALCFLIGALIYATRIPEVFFPGKFDFFGHSHQIWHLLVIAGFFFQFLQIQALSLECL